MKKELDTYGPIRRVKIVRDERTGKSRGYAFIEFESERDMSRESSVLSYSLQYLTYSTEAYKHADGKKIDGRRICVDVERGRTVQGWKPRRLGGGLGSVRVARPKQVKKSVVPLLRVN